jgi:hypothetical protein
VDYKEIGHLSKNVKQKKIFPKHYPLKVYFNTFVRNKKWAVKFYQILFISLFLNYYLSAQTAKVASASSEQAALPAMTITTEQAQNNLVWYSQYDGIKSISIQRSSDSIRNFVTIGIINAPKKGMNQYRDLHPVVGKNYYRLSIEFGGDLEWFSNTYKVILDSATLAKSLEEKIKTGTTNATNNIKTTASVNTNSTASTPTASTPTEFYFSPSSKIYTNPYTGHINISLDDALSRRYSLRFYDPSKNEVLKISRISKPILILDKNNFNSRGIYSFQLFDGSSLVETGYITIY